MANDCGDTEQERLRRHGRRRELSETFIPGRPGFKDFPTLDDKILFGPKTENVMILGHKKFARPMAALASASTAQLYPTLAAIDAQIKARGRREHIRAFMSLRADAPGLDDISYPTVALYRDLPPAEIPLFLHTLDSYLKYGIVEQNWDKMYTYMSEDAVYATLDGTLWVDKSTIIVGLTEQLALMRNGVYTVVSCIVQGNQAHLSVNNTWTAKGGKPFSVINDSIFYYGTDGKLVAFLDLANMVRFYEMMAEYMAEDTKNGGDVVAHFVGTSLSQAKARFVEWFHAQTSYAGHALHSALALACWKNL